MTDAVPETLESSLQLSEAVLIDLGLAMGPVIASIHEKRSEMRAEIMAEGELAKEPTLGRRRARDSVPAGVKFNVRPGWEANIGLTSGMGGQRTLGSVAFAAVTVTDHFLIGLIFDPSRPIPAIRPFWPKGKAITSFLSVVVVLLMALPWSITTTLGPEPIDHPSCLFK